MDGSRYAYNCRLDDSIAIPKKIRQPERYSGFVIKLQFCNKVEAPNGDVFGVLDSFTEVFDIPRQVFIDDDEAMEFLLYIFLLRVQIGESFRYAVIDEALDFTHSLVNDVTHAGKEILRILVDVVVRTLQRPNESVQEAIARASRECAEAADRDVCSGEG
ncbi:hypothetical protein RHMOL_Rhmol06G0045000 [Rhododendron molle]|uniref:Uncharacterized protein n=1 Tax=Rhododendron molle TaxID=49168 RepID=A0ACC0N8T1_RHOML|nr:hypothetical protein RHMOL_Rhmol06G0045000 [Rhododendron molle]